MRQFVNAEKSVVEDKKELEAPAPGMKLLSKKADSDADALFTGMGGKKGKGARKAAEKAHKAADTVKVDTLAEAASMPVWTICIGWDQGLCMWLPRNRKDTD